MPGEPLGCGLQLVVQVTGQYVQGKLKDGPLLLATQRKEG